jgi:hypothetical protein
VEFLVVLGVKVVVVNIARNYYDNEKASSQRKREVTINEFKNPVGHGFQSFLFYLSFFHHFFLFLTRFAYLRQ